jgi:DNA ligase (NAD+)
MNIIELKNNPVEFLKKLDNISIIENIIKNANKCYFNDEPLISDNIYDLVIERLKHIDSNNILLKQIGIDNTENKTSLPYFMGSMNKIKTEKEVLRWVNRFKRDIGNTNYVVSEKLDGISVLLVKKNSCIKLYTRGDGTRGRDISYLLKYNVVLIEKINNIHKNKSKINEIVLRGEIIISHSNYTDYIKKKIGVSYSSARSMVNGLLSLKEPSNILNILDIVFYEVIVPVMPPIDQFLWLKKNCFDSVNTINCDIKELTNWENEKSSYLHNCLKQMKHSSRYEIDGIIITHNKIYDRFNENPKYSVAFKSNDIGEITTIKEIIWEPSKYNLLIPRIHFNKIKLGTSNVEFCTGFSAKYIKENSLGPGSVIRVVLSGEVIPYICDIIEVTNPQMPDIDYVWCESKIHIISQKEDKLFRIKQIQHFIKTLKIENLSNGIINNLYKNGFNTISKILTITKHQLLLCDGIKEKLSNKIYTNIHKIIDNPINLGLLMVASLKFNSGFGIKKIDKILSYYPDILRKKYTIVDLNKIEGIQKITAKQFLDNLGEFIKFMNKLNFINFFVKQKSDGIKNENSKIKGKKIVLTGFRDQELIDKILYLGATIQISVNNLTDYLVIKDDITKSTKKDKAIILNKKILTRDEFMDYIDL